MGRCPSPTGSSRATPTTTSPTSPPGDELVALLGRADFLYVSDCKLASTQAMGHIDSNGGRFVTVLPRTRAEDAAFRATVQAGEVGWRQIHVKRDEQDTILDEFSIASTPMQTVEGDRLVWYHSTLKAECDAASRLKRLERVVARLDELRKKLGSPRTRYRARAQVSEAVEAIVEEGLAIEGLEPPLRFGRQHVRADPDRHERLRFGHGLAAFGFRFLRACYVSVWMPRSKAGLQVRFAKSGLLIDR